MTSAIVLCVTIIVLLVVLGAVSDSLSSVYIDVSGKIKLGFSKPAPDEPPSVSVKDDSAHEELVEIGDSSIPVEYAPIVLDVTKRTNIDILSVNSGRAAAVFVTPTSADANALVELFAVAMPPLAEKFIRGGVWTGDDAPYGVDALVGLEECDNCEGYHFDVKVTVLVPRAIMRDLTECVHRFFYPNGIEDIVDV